MAGIPQIPNALAPNHNPGVVPPAMGGSQVPQTGMMHTMGTPLAGIGQQILGGIGDFRNALMDYRGQRPQFAYDPNSDQSMQAQRMAFNGQMADYRDQRPRVMDYLGFPGGHMGGGQVMTPGGGGGTGPIQGNPGQQVGMVPGVPGSMGTNPNPPVYQFPTY